MAEDETPSRALAKLSDQMLVPARSLAERTLASLRDRSDRALATPDGRVAASSPPSEDYGAISAPSSTGSSSPTGSPADAGAIEGAASIAPIPPPRLGRTLVGRDLETWSPSGEAEARETIEHIGDFCAEYCPVRLACEEEACRLYRLEGRALEALGIQRNDATEAVGVLGQSVIGIG